MCRRRRNDGPLWTTITVNAPWNQLPGGQDDLRSDASFERPDLRRPGRQCRHRRLDLPMVLCRRIGHGYQAGSVAPLCLIAPSCCSSRTPSGWPGQRHRLPLRGQGPDHRRPGPAHARQGNPRPAHEEHVGKVFYEDLVTFMSRGPVVAMVIEGPDDTWEVVKSLMGATNPRKADPGTITRRPRHPPDRGSSRPWQRLAESAESARSTSSSRNCNLRRG